MTGEAATYDLLLRGGHVVDPANNINGSADVGVLDGKIAAVGPNLDPSQATKTLDVSGLYVTPGLIDIHTHPFSPQGSEIAPRIPPDQYGLPTGTTTLVDCGSSGTTTMGQFRDQVVNPTKSRVLSFVNICNLGMIRDCEQNVANLVVEDLVEAIENNRDIVVGIKSAHYMGPGWESIDNAVAAGAITGVPVIIDARTLPTRPYNEMVLEHMRPGDIVTHMFREYHPTLDDNDNVQPYLFEARKRGVIFDIGHGGAGFLWRNAVPAMEQGFGPDTISTDAHNGNYYIQRANMPITMSKLMTLGMSLEEAVRRATVEPAKVINRPELGTLSVGAEADLAAFALDEGEFPFVDSYRAVKMGTQRLDCKLTLRAGEIVWNIDARGMAMWDTQGKYLALPL
jgi:dihydroorotase